jgi:site-specific DNA recombinase
MKRAIIYARVSTDEQADNSSIESQIAACIRYAEQQGMTITVTLSDVMSGAKLDRPGLSKARDLLRLDAADALVIYCSDRLTRSLAHSLLLRDEFKAAGVAVHFVTKGESQHTPEGNLFESIESAFAEYERLKIAERMARGRKAALEKGKAFVGHAPPFGYKYAESGVLAIDDEQANVVRQIYQWYLQEGLGAPSIINRLAALQIPSPADRRAYNLKPKSKRGVGQWCSTTILHILRSGVYKGQYAIKHAGETINVAVPPIVDEITWQAVAQKREERKKFSRRNATFMYLLRGRVRCGKCGAACTGTLINGQKAWAQRYYACLRKYHTTMYIGEGGRCDMPRFRCDHLEPVLWEWIDREVLNEEHIRTRASTQGDVVQQERDRLEAERTTYVRQIESLDSQIGRLAQLFAAGLFQMEEIASQKGPLDAAKVSCRKEIERIDGLLAGMQSIGERVNELSDLVRAIREKIEAGPHEETKRIIIDLLDVQVLIVLEDGQKYADVTCHLTMDSARLLVAGMDDLSKTTTDRHSGSYWSAAP